MLQSLYINTSLPAFFGAKSIVKINYSNAGFTSSASTKVWLTLYKMVKTYIISVIMNQNYVLKILCLQSTAYTCLMKFWYNFHFMPAFFHWDISVILSQRHFGHCEISVCPIVVLDLTIFTSLYFRTLWLNFFRSFKKIRSMTKKTALR